MTLHGGWAVVADPVAWSPGDYKGIDRLVWPEPLTDRDSTDLGMGGGSGRHDFATSLDGCRSYLAKVTPRWPTSALYFASSHAFGVPFAGTVALRSLGWEVADPVSGYSFHQELARLPWAEWKLELNASGLLSSAEDAAKCLALRKALDPVRYNLEDYLHLAAFEWLVADG